MLTTMRVFSLEISLIMYTNSLVRSIAGSLEVLELVLQNS